MDPLISTIIKQSGAILLGCALLGLAAAVIYGLVQYGKLQYAMTLNLIPPQLP